MVRPAIVYDATIAGFFYGDTVDPLNQIVLRHEGLRLKPYTDTVGKITIGIGRNLTDCGISEDEAYTLLEHDLTRCQLQILQYAWYSALDDVRKGVLIELVFNVGLTKTLLFKDMIEALKNKDFSTASKELLDSAWAKQVGQIRSNNMATRLLTGRYL